MKKLLLATLMVALMMATVFHYGFLEDNTAIGKGLVKNEVTSNKEEIGFKSLIDDSIKQSSDKRKISRYENCHIYTLSCNAGRVYLIPGYLASTKKHGTYVYNGSGFGIGDMIQWTGYLYINEDRFTNWHWMIIIKYTGELKNYFEYGPGLPDRAYFLDGYAKLVIICYNN